MQDRSRARLAAFSLLTLPLLIANAAAEPAAVPAGRGGVDVTIAVSDLRNVHGRVMACMTADPQRFPRCRDDAASYRVTVPADQAGTIRIHGVRPGTYAIALLHDENSNGKADRALSMIPKEGFGFSRDAKVHMGPPAFGEASFRVGDTAQRQAIRMRYML